MAYNVAVGTQFFWEFRVAFDLVEKNSGREFEEICEEVEATTVWHSENDMF